MITGQGPWHHAAGHRETGADRRGSARPRGGGDPARRGLIPAAGKSRISFRGFLGGPGTGPCDRLPGAWGGNDIG
jgi:hypothetical protein